MITQFKIEFLPPFADCRKVLGKYLLVFYQKKYAWQFQSKITKKLNLAWFFYWTI